MKINHIAIAVDNVEESCKKYQEALDVKNVEFETVETAVSYTHLRAHET